MIKAKKSLGQNFLTDSRISRLIVDAVSPRQFDLVLEIGPGRGALTELLAGRSGFVIAVEIDARLADELRRSVIRKNLSIIEADALTVNWNDLISAGIQSSKAMGHGDAEVERVRIVANLPYYISTPIIERLIRLRSRIFDLTLMLQNEVVERIASQPGTKEYGYLSVLVQSYCEATKLFEVPPAAFRPVPKVQSAVVRLAVRDKLAVDVSDESEFFRMVRASFAQRRKTILNNLKAAPGALVFVRPIESALRASGIDPKRRAETISIKEFGALYRELFAK